MTDLDRQSRLYAADRLLDTMDGNFRAQDIKQAYMDGYNAAMGEVIKACRNSPDFFNLFVNTDPNTAQAIRTTSNSITSITPITSTP